MVNIMVSNIADGFTIKPEAIYCIAGYLYGVQLSQMPSIYHEPVIFMDVLFATWRFLAEV